MKKTITIISFVLLVSLSFIITDKISNIVVKNDEIMLKIKEVSLEYNDPAIDGKVENNTFIPGISGSKINIKKSYNGMKKYGVFINSLLKYDNINPRNRLKDNYNKYIISGNKEKKMVSLIFLIHSEDDINSITNILSESRIKANFFIDGYWFEKNKSLIPELIKKGHIVGNLSYNSNYNDGAYIWMDTVIKKLSKQKDEYCYTEKENSEILRICTMNKNYTIIPNLVLKNNYLSSIKKNLENGIIISLDVNSSLINELSVIIKYIQSKGYKLENLENLLSENN